MLTKPQSECALEDEKDREKRKNERQRKRDFQRETAPLTVNFNQKCLIIFNAKKMDEQEILIEKLGEKKNVMAKTI